MMGKTLKPIAQNNTDYLNSPNYEDTDQDVLSPNNNNNHFSNTFTQKTDWNQTMKNMSRNSNNC